MKRFYIKLLILFTFILSTNALVFAEEGIDISEFKKIKNVKTIFKKKPKKEKTKKTFDFKEVPYDNNEISNFNQEDEPSLMSDVTKEEPVVDVKANKDKKSRFNFFKRKAKKEEIELEEQRQDVQEAQIEERTYINDTDLVYIKEIEIFGNNLLDTNFIKDKLESKEGTQYVRSNVSNDLKALYATGYFTRNLRALPIKIDNNNIKLRIIVEENPPISGFALIGNNSISTSEIMGILSSYEGKPSAQSACAFAYWKIYLRRVRLFIGRTGRYALSALYSRRVSRRGMRGCVNRLSRP